MIGALSDQIGRKKTFLLVGVCAAILLPLCYLGLAKTTDTTTITLYALAIAFVGNAGYAPVLIFLNERFPTALRASGTGLSWNIGFALGGMMPTFVSLVSGGPATDPDIAVDTSRSAIFRDLSRRRDHHPGDEGKFPLSLGTARSHRWGDRAA